VIVAVPFGRVIASASGMGAVQPVPAASITAQITDDYGNQSVQATDNVTVAETLPTVAIARSPAITSSITPRRKRRAACP
jgi:hypothetical protein